VVPDGGQSSATYVWQHALGREPERLRLMSDILDASSRFHLRRIGVGRGWRCLEVGAGNGSLSAWIADQVGPEGLAIATDLDPDLLEDASGRHLELRCFDVVTEEPTDGPFDLVLGRAVLHHLPQRREVVAKMARWVRPGGWIFLQEPDFYPTGTVEPEDQRRFWQGFLRWAEEQQIDYFVGRKIAPWLQEEGLEDVAAEGHTTLYNGGSPYARWWQLGIAEVADQLLDQEATESATLDEFFRLYDDPRYWTMTIAFTAVTGRRGKA
jgi:2-polyprenyl-3-methyl-5-hydroxy-6-metoxy-1,4-benzoquinol methylase